MLRWGSWGLRREVNCGYGVLNPSADCAAFGGGYVFLRCRVSRLSCQNSKVNLSLDLLRFWRSFIHEPPGRSV